MQTITEMARKGGKACAKKHGKVYMAKIGRLGAIKRWKQNGTRKTKKDTR